VGNGSWQPPDQPSERPDESRQGDWLPAPDGAWQSPGEAPAPAASSILRPRALTVGDTLDGAFQVLKAAWPAGLLAVVLLSVLDDLITWWLITGYFEDLAFLLPFEEAVPPLEDVIEIINRSSGAMLLLNLIATAFVVYSGLAVLVAALHRDAGRPAGLGKVLGIGLRLLPGVFGALLLFGFLTSIAIMGTLIVTGLIHQALLIAAAIALIPVALALVGVYAITPAAAVLEDRGGWAALRRAIRIVRARPGRTMGVILLGMLILLLLVLGFGLVSFVFLPLGDGPFLIGSYVLSTVAVAVALAVFAGLGAMLLADGAARLEGADLSERAQGLRRKDSPPGPTDRW
jgi:hypothetical protein